MHTGFNTDFIILVLVISFPLVFLGYYLYKKLLAKLGISITGASVLSDSFSTDIGNNIKNGFLRFLANITGSIFVTVIFLIYIWIVYTFSSTVVSRFLE